MKKLLGISAVLLAGVNLYAHNQFIYTDTLDVTDKKAVPFKIIFGHPDGGGTEAPIPVGKTKEVTSMGKKVFAVHGEEVIDLTSKVKEGTIKTDVASARTLDFVIDKELRGAGNWVVVAIPGETFDEEISYTFNGMVKTVIEKDGGSGNEWKRRVVDGHYEILPFTHPAKVYVNSVFKGQVVDKMGKPMKNVDISLDYVNGKIDLKKETFSGKFQDEKEIFSTYTDENGYFVASFPHKGLWSIRAKASIDREKKYVEDTTLLIEVK